MSTNNISTKEYSVTIGENAHILDFNRLTNCTIGASKILGSDISNSTIHDGCDIKYSTIEESKVFNNVSIGVYSHLRRGSDIRDNVRIGNFVETKQSTIDNDSKVAHLTYVGDAEIGKRVNVWCGTVFCNYNGVIKQKTVVGDDVFIGSNSNLVAPLHVENQSFIAAGSTITNDVPKHCLAIARSRQTNKLGYYKPKIT